ncbi:MAG TPA: AP2 domain-containing protein [Plantibacter sp.]|uniref:HNH endonuclease n=1 Tax=Plantibacter sp. TaxID=1871045 RepID=UPI002C142BCC|nr:AP2 domain-containing protein [Plantibacter sp.]
MLPLHNRAGLVIAHAIIDDEDALLLASARWGLRNREGYVATVVDGRREALHRIVMGCARGDGQRVDHISGDRLDNRRANLRLVTNAENAQNQGSRGGSSSHRGVTWDRARGRWLAQSCLNGKQHTLGRFDSEEAAARAAAAFRAAHMPYSQEARSAA